MFTKATFKFLTELKNNNRREWFQENKARYEEHVLQPSLEFIEGMGPLLRRAAPYLTAIAKRTGGSLTRIYRDTRFSNDKTPYKTNIGIQFRHEEGPDIHAPGVYVHISPGDCLVAAGCYRPDPQTLKLIRTAILEDPKGWLKARNEKKLAERFSFWGESLKGVPREVPKDHPQVDDLRRKDYMVVAPLTEAQVTSGDLLETMVDHIKRTKPFMKFMCHAMEFDY